MTSTFATLRLIRLSSSLTDPQFDKVLKYIETGKKEAKLETGGASFPFSP